MYTHTIHIYIYTCVYRKIYTYIVSGRESESRASINAAAHMNVSVRIVAW